MIVEPKIALRLQFLARVVRKKCQHLATTDQRLFGSSFTPEQAIRLEQDPDLAGRVDAFVSRFGRLQETVGDKLLLLLLRHTTGSGNPTCPTSDCPTEANQLRLAFLVTEDAYFVSHRLPCLG